VTGKRKLKLTPKQERFVDEYLIDLNATQAAIRAGYSKGSARQQACVLLTNPNIQAAIGEGRAKLSERTGITAQRVLDEIARISFADPRRLFDANGSVLPPSEWDDDTAAMIAGVEVVTRSRPGEESAVEYVHKFRLWDKNSALDKLMKHLGEYAADKHEHSVTDGGLSKEAVTKIRREILGIR